MRDVRIYYTPPCRYEPLKTLNTLKIISHSHPWPNAIHHLYPQPTIVISVAMIPHVNIIGNNFTQYNYTNKCFSSLLHAPLLSPCWICLCLSCCVQNEYYLDLINHFYWFLHYLFQMPDMGFCVWVICLRFNDRGLSYHNMPEYSMVVLSIHFFFFGLRPTSLCYIISLFVVPGYPQNKKKK